MDANNLSRSALTAITRRAFLTRLAGVASGLPLAAACAPNLPTQVADPQTITQCRQYVPRTGDVFGFLVGGATPVHPDIQGVYVDQFGGQAEYEVLPDLSVGVEYNGRRQGQTIEDMSPDDGNHYFIGNPGYGQPFEVLADGHSTKAGCSAEAIADGRPGSLSDGMQRLADQGRAATMDIGESWWIDVDDPRAFALAQAEVRTRLPRLFDAYAAPAATACEEGPVG